MLFGDYSQLVVPGYLAQENLKRAVAWLASGAWKTLEDGKTVIDGDRIYALVSRYDSREERAGRFESHRKYIDIQMLIEGAEWIFVQPTVELPVSVEYDGQKDIDFRSGAIAGSHALLMTPSLAAVLFPEDAHMPCIAIDGKSSPIHKLVLKVAVC